MKIAIDGMGGDNAPAAVIEGVIQALKEYNNTFIIKNHYYSHYSH